MVAAAATQRLTLAVYDTTMTRMNPDDDSLDFAPDGEATRTAAEVIYPDDQPQADRAKVGIDSQRPADDDPDAQADTNSGCQLRLPDGLPLDTELMTEQRRC